MYISDDDLPQYVICLRDFGGNHVGSMNYGYMMVPMNIDDEADEEYYESLLDEINEKRAAAELPPYDDIGDIPHRTINEYEWSYPAYFELSSKTGTPSLSSDGKDWPVSLEVLKPGTSSDEDGDIFNRVYEVQTKVYGYHVDFPTGDYPTSNVWIDKASMAASVSAKANKDDWKGLIFIGSTYNPYIPYY